jgi:hypothetical protein
VIQFKHLPDMYRADYDRDRSRDERDARAHVSDWMRRQTYPLRTEIDKARAAKDHKTFFRAKGRLAVFDAAVDHLYDEQTPVSLREKADRLDAESEQVIAESDATLPPHAYELRHQAKALREVADEWERDLAARRAETDAAWIREDEEYGA